MPEPIRIEKAAPPLADQALELSLGHLPNSQPMASARRWLTAADGTRGDVWIARRGERLLAAMRTEALGGRSAVVSVPRTIAGEQAEIAQALLAAAVADLASRGATVIQALADGAASEDTKTLTQCGFSDAANLLLMVSLARSFPKQPPSDDLELVPYSPAELQRLAEIVRLTYIGSLDCPKMAGARAADETLESYRLGGHFDPRLWRIARQSGADVGCLLVSDFPSDDQCELTYLGLVPQARGRGLGLKLVRHAQWMAAQQNRSRLVLAVDADNHPAVDVYDAAGFIVCGRRQVWIHTNRTAS